ncbi:hypothetical protein HRbin41_01136 [bacterium HR41]|nr:hypothetical protein HRbin41_01136 [bacterium HR41]
MAVAAPRTSRGTAARIDNRVAIGLFVVAAVAVSWFLRTRALGASLWMDEGLSIGIASQPLDEIPTVLRQDGSPPLYYLLLGLWVRLIGNGPAETQALSVLIAVASIPIGLWAGWSLFGRRAGIYLAALCAVNPFLTTYAQEVRMYSLMLTLSLATSAAFLNAFVLRRRAYLAPFAVLLAAMLYTHNWALFVSIGLVTALLWLLVESAPSERRALVRDAGMTFGAAGVLYLPWLPTLLFQVQHTGAPWLNPPRLGAPVQISKYLLGGGTATSALALAGGSGIAEVFRRGRDDPERRTLFAAALVVVAMLASAWLVSQVSPAWTTRYLGASLGPLMLIFAAGLARAGKLGIVALCIVLAIWSLPRLYDLRNKSNAADLAQAAVGQLRPGDLVISLQPEQTPLLAYHLETLRGERGLRYATPLGPVANRFVMDWRDSQKRLERATVAKNLEPLLASLPRRARVLLVHPIAARRDDWDAPWTALVRRRAAQWGAALATDRRFRRVATVPPFYRRATRIGVRAVLYEKTGA